MQTVWWMGWAVPDMAVGMKALAAESLGRVGWCPSEL
jgi:hypothetical protein